MSVEMRIVVGVVGVIIIGLLEIAVWRMTRRIERGPDA